MPQRETKLPKLDQSRCEFPVWRQNPVDRTSVKINNQVPVSGGCLTSQLTDRHKTGEIKRLLDLLASKIRLEFVLPFPCAIKVSHLITNQKVWKIELQASYPS